MKSLLMTMYILSAVASLAMLVMGMYARSAPRSRYFTLLTLAIFILNVGFLFEITASSFATAFFAAQVQYFGGPFIAPFVLLFVCEYCGIQVRNKLVTAAMIIPLMACFSVLTWPLNGVFYQSVTFTDEALIPHLVVEGSFFYYLFQLHNAALPLAADAILIYHYFRRDKMFKRQSFMIILATILPFLSIIFVLVLGIAGLDFDPTPIFLGITCLLLGYSVLKLGLYRVAPIARDQTVETMSDGFILLDTQGKFIDANIAAKNILPQLAITTMGVKISDIEEIAWLSENSDRRQNEFSAKESGGMIKHYQLSETEVKLSNKVIGRCIMIFDITENKQLLDATSLLAERDALTGLINRRTLFSNGTRMLEKLEQKNGSACMLMIDIDFFKKVNDTYGHIKGDEVLKAMAKIMTSRFRHTDLIVRYGGEEFCVLLPDTHESAALNIARQLRQRTEKLMFRANESVFRITISIGLAVYDAEYHKQLDMLLSDADAALYAAKNGGRNTIYVARPEGTLTNHFEAT